MAIFEKPSGSMPAFGSPEQAVQNGTAAINIQMSAFVTTLQHPEVWALNESAKHHRSKFFPDDPDISPAA
jgi:hypothetical protein